MAGFEVSRVDRDGWVIVGGGVLVLIASLLPWYGLSTPFASVSVSGWGAGFTAWFSVLLCVAAGGYVLARATGVALPTVPLGPSLLVVGLVGLAVVLLLIRLITLPTGGAGGILAGSYQFSYGPRMGLFVALAGAIAQLVFGYLWFRRSGEALPGRSVQLRTPPDTPPPS